MVWIYTIASVVAVSLISLIGVFTLSIKREKLNKILIYLVSLAAGSLMGGAFLHLIPEAFSEGDLRNSSMLVLGGILIFFILEKVISWRHCHKVACEDHPHPFSYMILIGDFVHNFVDGLVIAVSYLVSIHLGIATTLAVILHEIPQEIGDFGSLVYGGFSIKKALFYNFLSAFSAILGAILILVLSFNPESLMSILLPLAGGGFIYIAGSDLIPELHKHRETKTVIFQILTFILGIGLMFGLLFLE